MPQESDALSSAILGLKGRGREKTWAELAQLFINQHAVEVFQKSEIRLFALPNSNPYRTHAADFAKGFAEILGVEGEELAQAATWGLPQKRKTRRQRLSDVRRVSMAPEARGGLRARGTPEDPARTVLWVLVDDIVTTGATSLMALRSLQEKSEGAGNSYEIWSLARRSRLAP
ncbi:MAG: phosphoribosyltransferase [Bdellovibrionaceae bacterium]|nr:phosphoribosyltransferase [Pseudobdellovibrionaceae bacterium]